MQTNSNLRFLHPETPIHSQGKLAVIDIGSSSARLVVYDDLQNYPHLVLNQRVLTALGTGKGQGDAFVLDAERMQRTIDGLKWFLWTAERAGCTAVVATATSAVRDAANGTAFVERVAAELGLKINIISGEVEAQLAAHGAMVSMPDAEGVVLDLGSGSYELCETHGAQRLLSLPLGVLALQSQSGGNPKVALELVRTELAKTPWIAQKQGQDIVALGSGMRSLARMHMAYSRYPLATLHDYRMSAAAARAFCEEVLEGTMSAAGLNHVWKDVLPFRAASLLALLEQTQAKQIRFATFGLREGVLFTQVGHCPVIDDPLQAFTAELAERDGRGSRYAKALAGWVQPLFPELELRHLAAAGALAEVGWREFSVYRAETVFKQVLGASFVAIGHKERVLLALIAFSRHEDSIPPHIEALAMQFLSAAEMAQARLVGAVFHLASVLDPGFSGALEHFYLTFSAEGAVLSTEQGALPCMGEVVGLRLEKLNALLEVYRKTF